MSETCGRISERDLDKTFEMAIKASPAFCAWFLERTGSGVVAATLFLSRSNNPWYISKETKQQSETDVLLVFETADGLRFAIHIENKIGSGRLKLKQAETYRIRAQDWCGLAKYGSYVSFKTVLIAPSKFLTRYAIEAAPFDYRVSHEEISCFIPAFTCA